MLGDESAGDHPSLPDREARERIARDLETNLLVEAGAGSGKTTELVSRMVALVVSEAASVDQIAAVTFTRKAAAELRERFQLELEKRLREVGPSSPAAPVLGDAIRDIDQAFLGTIHAFCARLLRERPLDAGLDPGFQETLEVEARRLKQRFWRAFLERLTADTDPALGELDEVGLRPDRLEDAFDFVVENLDVEFPIQAVPRPAPDEVAAVREEFSALLDRALALLPEREPAAGWGDLQKKVRSLDFSRRGDAWRDDRAFFDALATVCEGSKHKPTQNRWSSTKEGKRAAKELGKEFQGFAAERGPAQTLLDRWLAHRYPVALRLVQRAAREFAKHRRKTGQLSFQDLLMLTAQLLRERPDARRDLGRRYRRILVDEFQDTDPIQAEVVFLLASDPEDDAPDGGRATWRTARPKPGALFVVGDPKQSIYRFRRADISVYNFVRQRFEAFGDILTLEANFRSRDGIGELVNGVFGHGGLFPEEATEHQAAFAPLLPQPKDHPAPREGVFDYEVGGTGHWGWRQVEAEAGALASWVRRRIDSGERRAGDFMILTRTRRNLERYARALEDRDVPIDVSGAGVGFEEELSELTTLLTALADPGNPVATVAVLVGLFFGIDYEELTAHRLAGGVFDFTRPTPGGTGGVSDALVRLHDWWQESRRRPADVFIGRLVSDLGLVPYAAAGTLGTLRAGTLAYAKDAIRARAIAGDTSLVGAVEALGAALDWEDAEAHLEPGREDVVRVMNVHRAKGLQATVVILAEPGGERTRTPSRHIRRGDRGEAFGFLCVDEKGEWGAKTPLARPLEWRSYRDEETLFETAEADRVLYVAATRAKDELVVGRQQGSNTRSPWTHLDDWLQAHATRIDGFEVEHPSDRERLERTAEEMTERVARADAGRSARSGPTYRFESVTEVAKRGRAVEREEPAEEDQRQEGTPPGEGWASSDTAEGANGGAVGSQDEAPGARSGETGSGPGSTRTAEPVFGKRRRASQPAGGARGYEWGSVVHAALAAAVGGMEGEPLKLVCRSLLVEFERPVDDMGEPTELDELVGLVARVRSSDLWRRAMGAERRFSEVPFAVERPGAGDGIPQWIEGVIDLAFREDDGWVIADYKSDVGDDPEFEERSASYRRQVDLYAECWSSITGEPVKERVILFTAQGRAEKW